MEETDPAGKDTGSKSEWIKGGSEAPGLSSQESQEFVLTHSSEHMWSIENVPCIQ